MVWRVVKLVPVSLKLILSPSQVSAILSVWFTPLCSMLTERNTWEFLCAGIMMVGQSLLSHLESCFGLRTAVDWLLLVQGSFLIKEWVGQGCEWFLSMFYCPTCLSEDGILLEEIWVRIGSVIPLSGKINDFITNPDKAASPINSVPSTHVGNSDHDMLTGWDILSLGSSQWYFACDSGLQV